MNTRRISAPIALGLLFCFSALSVPALAQEKFDFYSRGPYRSQVPRPSSITGYEPGLFQTPHGQIVRVLEALAAAAPDRVRLIESGETWERRKLYQAVVSAPENLARLDEIKANVARLADPRRTTAEEAAQIAASTPIIVWLNYGIHGNESASYEAVQQTIYQLAASEEPRTLEILRNAVIVFNTMHNPDGHERFAVWINSVAIGNAEPIALEHREPYMSYGRGNHYRFDMNRDMLALSQPENHSVLRGVREWKPQVFVDHHGQVDNYFFPPAAEPINKNLPVDRAKHWYDKFGRGNAAAFDRYGWNYYVRHIFDIFYAGYMDSWSSLTGATGMTYETDAGGPTSLNVKLDDETILTFRQGIAKHHTASMATLETAVANREERLKDFHAFFGSGVEEAQGGPMRRVVLLPGKDPARTALLVRNLVRQGIEVSVAREAFRSAAAHDYFGSKSAREFPAGAYIVDLAQPQKRLAVAQLEPSAALDEDFIKRELERRARNERRGKNVPKEGYEFYDITSWSLPLASGVEAFWTEDTPAVKSAAITLSETQATGEALQRMNALDLEGLGAADSLGLPGIGGGGVEGGRATAAYVIPYGSEAAARLTIALLDEGFKIAIATRQLNAGGRNWPAGTLIARVHRNPETLHNRLPELALSTGARAFAVNSSFAEEGDTGIGSEYVASLKKPEVAVVWDEGTSPTGFGAMWFAFERTYGLKFTPLRIATLKSADLSKFNVIILPEGGAGAYQSQLAKGDVDRLKEWVRGGGVLIGIGGAAEFFTKKDVELTSSRLVGAEEAPPPAAPEKPEEKKPEAEKKPDVVEGPAPEAKKPKEPLPVPGASFRARLDRHHFLSFGYDSDALVVLVNGEAFFTASKDGANVVTFAKEGPIHVAGFVWPDNTLELLRGTSHVIDEPTGRGHVIMFAGDPNFRYLWRTTSQMFLNAILLGPSLR